MEEADGSDRVVILDGGKIVAEDTPVQLKNRYSSNYLHLYGDPAALGAELDRQGICYLPQADGVSLKMPSALSAREFLQKYPALCGDFEFVKGSMDDVFLAVTGKNAEGGDK